MAFFGMLTLLGAIVGLIMAIYFGFKKDPKWKKCLIGGISSFVLMIVLVAVDSSPKNSANNHETKPVQTSQSQQPAPTAAQVPDKEPTMKVTYQEFTNIYNKEIKQRLGDKSILGAEKPVRDDTVMHDIPFGNGSNIILNFNPANKNVKVVTFTIQGESGTKFDRKSLRAWTASIISATSPGISNDDIIAIRGSILGNTPIIKNGIYYMAQYTEKGAPFFQIIARAQ